VYGAVPPVAETIASYGVDVAAAGNAVDEIWSGGGVIWMLRFTVALRAGEPESTIFAVK
jgi:hypothetical protein